ncbi:type III secretion system translocon subunit SctE [Serratia marcescens]|uniref:type III secretion system translocon subunit SctE n=1 Tax=Serratia marcescens TaxID=615 RepID=UPI00148C01F3|nr:type III secretion system translocon subunit SctE [Serratia marcescens]QJU42314.1 type III secretion system translocon subunit SctE [Serratia marcescens]
MNVNLSVKRHTMISPEDGQKTFIQANKYQQNGNCALRAVNVADIDGKLESDVDFDNALLLEAPVLPKGKMTRDASMLLLLCSMIELQGEQALQKLTDNLAAMQSMLDSNRKKAEKLSEEANNAIKANEAAIGEFKDAVNDLKDAQNSLQEKKKELTQAKEKLKQLQNSCGENGTPEYCAKLAAAEQKVLSAQSQYDAAGLDVSKAEEVSLQKQQVAMITQQEANKALTALKASVDAPGYAAVRGGMKQKTEEHLNNTAILSLTLAKFIQSVGDNSIKKLEDDLEITNAMQEANKKDMLKKAEEYEEQQRKAEDTNKMTGCLGKIIGGIATAVGVIGMAFGGAGAGLMAVGIGLMVLDPIVEAIAGKSLTEMVISPVMEHIFMPLMDLMSKLIDKLIDFSPIGLLLKELDKLTGIDITDMVKALAAAAATVAVFVAVAYVAKSAAKTLLDNIPKIVTQAINKAVKDALEHVSKAIPNMVKKGGRKASQQIAKLQNSVFKDPLSQEKWVGRMQLAHNTSMATGAITQATGGAIIGQLQKVAMDTLADFKITAADMEIIKQLSELVSDSFERKQQLVQQMWNEMRKQLVLQADTGRTIMRNLHA